MVGHSIGATIIRAFAALPPERLAGMVLIDPTDSAFVVAAGRPLLSISQYRLTWLLARIGLIHRFGADQKVDRYGRCQPAHTAPTIKCSFHLLMPVPANRGTR